MFDYAQIQGGNRIQIDRSRDNKLTELAIEALYDRYLLKDETPQDMFARVAMSYGDDPAHAQRLYDYMSNLWFMPSTSVLSNGGTSKGLPISCFLNETQDTLADIVALWNENVWLASLGGGIGSYWGNVRSVGETIGSHNTTSGVVPFIRVMDSITLAISQGNLRQGSTAVYIPIWHPEIEEFIDMRKTTNGDPARKVLNLHHGVLVNNAFMQAVENNEEWALRSPKDNVVISKIEARTLWKKLLKARLETGEPYIIHIDHVNDNIPDHHKMAGLNVKMSNLCSEITLPTGRDRIGNDRTAVCCLASINLDKFDEWQDEPQFIEDMMRLLDNVLSDFIDRAPDSMKRAKYAAMRERSVGLGVMGWHSFLQSKSIPMEGVMAKVWNRRLFQHLKRGADDASRKLAQERGACPDASDYGIQERFSNKIAIAPTASISLICGGSSPGIEPYAANAYRHQAGSDSIIVKNNYLADVLHTHNQNTDDIWQSICENDGSVQHLDFLTQEQKDIFKTAFEIDQRWLIEHAGDRASFICQSQSLSVFLSDTINEQELHDLHMNAWRKGIKSLYSCQSKAMQRTEKENIWTRARESTGRKPELPAQMEQEADKQRHTVKSV